MSTGERITRDDLEAKFREVQSDVTSTAEEVKGTAIAVGAGIGVVLLLLVFLLGRSRGRKNTTIVEVRRF